MTVVVEIGTLNILSELLRDRWKSGKGQGTREFIVYVDGVEAGLLIYQDWGAMGFVHEIFVLTSFRGNGIGTTLLRHAESIAVQLGCSTIQLFARSLDQEELSDVDLTSWYERNGFTQCANERGRLVKWI